MDESRPHLDIGARRALLAIIVATLDISGALPGASLDSDKLFPASGR
jgi:hypothetical protein